MAVPMKQSRLLRLGLGVGLDLDLTVFLLVGLLVTGLPSLARGKKPHHGLRRQLQLREFEPQDCVLDKCRPWTTLFGARSSYKNRIVVDCTVCVIMDHSDFRLEDGIDIRGRLVVPDGAELRMETTSIVVQGELIMSSTQKVDGLPPVIVTMVGDDDTQTFDVLNDPGQCRDNGGCKIGQKGIVVAGGSINLQGLPSNAPTWLPLFDVAGGSYNRPNTLIVADTVMSSWAAGAELLITSHTTEWNEQTTRSISSVRKARQPGYVELKLNEPLPARPTIAREDPDFAVEVALLSRNLVLKTEEGAAVGGHLEIRRTSANKQVLDGVDIRNFGQAGVKGRYPIHTHFCGDLDGSVVSRNTVRHSQQRCVVVHGTDRLLVQENIAYDTTGHCFMTEDGIETGNRFVGNLGAQTAAATALIEGENDDEPATFWIPNPTNYFIGNVAAGSEDSGFWFDARLRGGRAHMFTHLDPIHDDLLAFKDNVVHSSMSKMGGIRTYTPGYLPRKEVVFSHLRVYRNRYVGLMLHKCHNIIVKNSLFADNGRSLDIDRAENIKVENVVIIGESTSFKDVVSRQSGVVAPCWHHKLIGLDLHTWKLRNENGGATLRNMHFSGFENTACPKPSAIWMDGFNVRQGQFELYTSFEDITVDNGEKAINFCVAESKGVTSTYLVDLDGSFRSGQKARSISSPSVLLGSSSQMTTFIDDSICHEVSEGCYKYCSGVCFRSYRYVLDPQKTEDYKLRICRADKPNTCTDFDGSRRGSRDPRSFIGHMPTGFDYVAMFIDDSDDEVADPPIIDEQYEVDMCHDKNDFTVTLV